MFVCERAKKFPWKNSKIEGNSIWSLHQDNNKRAKNNIKVNKSEHKSYKKCFQLHSYMCSYTMFVICCATSFLFRQNQRQRTDKWDRSFSYFFSFCFCHFFMLHKNKYFFLFLVLLFYTFSVLLLLWGNSIPTQTQMYLSPRPLPWSLFNRSTKKNNFCCFLLHLAMILAIFCSQLEIYLFVCEGKKEEKPLFKIVKRNANAINFN